MAKERRKPKAVPLYFFRVTVATGKNQNKSLSTRLTAVLARLRVPAVVGAGHSHGHPGSRSRDQEDWLEQVAPGSVQQWSMPSINSHWPGMCLSRRRNLPLGLKHF